MFSEMVLSSMLAKIVGNLITALPRKVIKSVWEMVLSVFYRKRIMKKRKWTKSKLKLLIQRDKTTSEEFVSDFWNIVYLECYRIMGDEDDSLDMTQDFFANLHEVMSNLRKVKSVEAFIIGVAHRICMESIRKRRRRIELLKRARQEGWFCESTEIPWYEATELAEEITHLVSLLTDEEREVIMGYFYRELPVSKLAKILDRTEYNVNQILLRALKKLRKSLQE